MDDLDVAVTAARAGALVVRSAIGDPGTTMKGAVDPVTLVDTAAERAVLGVIAELRPDDATLSEEAGGVESATRLWVVDPIDGTVNFIHGVEHVSVSVGLWVDGEPEVGVVVDVHRDRTYAARAGGGATVDDRPLTVTSRQPGDALVAIGFPYDRRERAIPYGDLVARVLATCRGAIQSGSAALDFAWVAEGRLDGYAEVGLKPWDVAAGILLVREAGGLVLDHTGQPADLRSAGFVAGGEAVAHHLVDVLAPAVPS
jgi:myo-inositol-1(or 4)-monophosphatase